LPDKREHSFGKSRHGGPVHNAILASIHGHHQHYERIILDAV